jgi:hypothetical protein
MHGRSEAVWGKRGLVALLTVVVLAMSAGSATAAPASLRLFAATRQVAASQLQLRANAFNLGIWLGSTGGAFQIDLVRPNYGAWSATQIDPSTGATVRALPTSMANPVRGLVKFLSVRFVDARGRVVVRRTFAFCPAGETARVDGSGPQNPNYPFGCNVGFFPFTRGLVWGIDSGWAVQPAYGGIGSFGPGPGPGPGPGFIPPCLISHLHGHHQHQRGLSQLVRYPCRAGIGHGSAARHPLALRQAPALRPTHRDRCGLGRVFRA